MQARLLAHSLGVLHSGRQLGGLPSYPGRQEQYLKLFTTLHWECGPHGSELQGSTGRGVVCLSVTENNELDLKSIGTSQLSLIKPSEPKILRLVML